MNINESYYDLRIFGFLQCLKSFQTFNCYTNFAFYRFLGTFAPEKN